MPETPLQRERRLRRWRHFALLGSVRFAQVQIEQIKDADSTTEEAKQLAPRIHKDLCALLKALRKRNNC